MSADRFRSFDPSARYDAVVIGAGLGGLTTAALLAQAGRRALVLDQHYVAGGNATVFRRKGYVFDVGVHYIGDCGPGGAIPRVLREAGVEARFLPMDAGGFDTLCFPDGMRFAYPRGLEAFEARLLEYFPQERAGILKWTGFLRQVWRLVRAENRPLRLAAAVPRALGALRRLDWTLDEVLAGCTRDPRLKAVLIGPHLDHAVAPSRVSAVLHAGLVMHYLADGAYYPEGGGQALSDALVERIEAAGGKVLLLSTAERILVERGRAAGVAFRNKHLGRVVVEAKVVVSNADLKKTFERLVPAQAVPEALRRRVSGYEMAPGIAVLFLGARREPLGRAADLNTNYWVFPGDDMDHDYAALRRGRVADPPSVYVTLSSNKEPGRLVAPEGVMNLQLMAIAPSAPEAWGVADAGPGYRKSPSYQAHKRAVRDLLVQQASRVFPQLEEAIVYEELATPLTHARYTLSTGGTPYGIAETVEQFGWKRPGATTHLPGLLLAGASARNGHGVVGAMLSGREAAKAALQLLRRTPRPAPARPVRGPPLPVPGLR